MISQLLLPIVMAQNCFLLEGSQRCVGLENFAILESERFRNPQELDTYLSQNQYSSPSIVDVFKRELTCNQYEGKGVRFTDSTLCGFFITLSAQQCQPRYKDPNVRFSFCTETCDAHINSLRAVLSNTTICEANVPADVQAKRTLVTQPGVGPTNVNDFCAALKNDANAASASCFKGMQSEFSQCGFGTRPEAADFCAANPSEACCREFASTPATTGTEVLNPANNVFVISGIVAGGLALLGIGFLIFQRFSKSRQRPTTAYRQSKFQSKTQSKMFSLFKDNEQPPLPAAFEPSPKARSSLFTTIRASQVLSPGNAPSLPKPFQATRQNDNYQELEEGEFQVQAFEDYDAGMDDEISCTVGDIILVKEEYDDGIPN
jgi:hypothetical protein